MGSRQAVLLVPAELALGCGGIQCAVLLDAACIDIDQVAIGIVSIGMVVVYLGYGIRILFRAVVRILHFGELELFALSLAVGIGQVIAHMKCSVELHALLRKMLLLRHDAVHVVVAHLQPVGSGLAVRSGIGSRGTCQTVECVIRIGMRHLSARLSAFGKCGLVGNAEHVAYGIVGIAIVHDGLAACVDRQVLQPAACGLVGVEGLRSVAVFQIGALFELVIADAVHVVIAVGLVAAYLFQLTAEVIGVSDLLLVRVDHFQEAVVAVVDPLRHIGGNRLVGHNQRAAGLGDFAHLAVEVLDGTRSVLTEHQATDAVLRGVASAVVILHIVLLVVGIVDARQPMIIVVVGNGLVIYVPSPVDADE